MQSKRIARIAIFSTSDIQRYVGADTFLKATGNLRAAVGNDTFMMSTGNLERATLLGFDVWVLTTREKFSDTDNWWKEYVSADQILMPSDKWVNPECFVERPFYGANSPELIAPWLALYEKLGIPLPFRKLVDDGREWDQEGPGQYVQGFETWLQAKAYLLNPENLDNPDLTIVPGSDFEHRRIFHTTAELPYTYGPRILIEETADQTVLEGLKRFCLWGNFDRVWESRNGTKRFLSFEFPTNGSSTSEKFLAAKAYLESHQYLCGKPSMMPELVDCQRRP